MIVDGRSQGSSALVGCPSPQEPTFQVFSDRSVQALLSVFEMLTSPVPMPNKEDQERKESHVGIAELPREFGDC
jgi:hypothetical protein